MTIREAVDAIVNQGCDLSEDEAAAVMREIMSGEATSAQIGAFLVAFRLKDETVEEIAGMARAMREHSLRVEVEGPLVDTCGTGGDAQGTFNVSTAAAFVAAGAGAHVAKHGNRAATSTCGSADVLEALGAKIALPPAGVARCIREAGFGFMFAQTYHPAMRHVAGPRREIGIRTVFNILGPLTNPAGAQAQVLGVARPELAPKMAAALQRLGSRRVLVVHGQEGLDEFSLSGPSTVHEVQGDQSCEYTVSPEEVGLTSTPLKAIRGGSAQENAATLRAILNGEPGPQREIVLLNAAAALVAADRATNLREGISLAGEAIDSGAARRRLDKFIELSTDLA